MREEALEKGEVEEELCGGAYQEGVVGVGVLGGGEVGPDVFLDEKDCFGAFELFFSFGFAIPRFV